MVSKDELGSSNKISFLNKNPNFDLFLLFHDQNRGDNIITNKINKKNKCLMQFYLITPI
ncbi:hypothetical protein Gotur_009458, partial [Gossypium turneri]